MKHYGLYLNLLSMFWILKNMEDKNNNQHTASFTELKKDIADYQKKYMMETVSYILRWKLYNLAEILNYFIY